MSAMKILFIFSLALLLIPAAFSQGQPHASPPKEHSNAFPAFESAAGPEMERLAKLLTGDWNTTETMQQSPLFPNGGLRHGKVHVRLVAGGTTLIYEVHSDGSAGKLDGMLVIWWDKSISLYQFFACFNDPAHPCKSRGTGHWEGETFVNDYDLMLAGQKKQWRDSFTFTPSSHTLVAAMNQGDGTMKVLITTVATR
jgi:hypothetical protein